MNHREAGPDPGQKPGPGSPKPKPLTKASPPPPGRSPYPRPLLAKEALGVASWADFLKSFLKTTPEAATSFPGKTPGLASPRTRPWPSSKEFWQEQGSKQPSVKASREKPLAARGALALEGLGQERPLGAYYPCKQLPSPRFPWALFTEEALAAFYELTEEVFFSKQVNEGLLPWQVKLLRARLFPLPRETEEGASKIYESLSSLEVARLRALGKLELYESTARTRQVWKKPPGGKAFPWRLSWQVAQEEGLELAPARLAQEAASLRSVFEASSRGLCTLGGLLGQNGPADFALYEDVLLYMFRGSSWKARGRQPSSSVRKRRGKSHAYIPGSGPSYGNFPGRKPRRENY